MVRRVLSFAAVLAITAFAACETSPCDRTCDRGVEADRCMALHGDDERARCIRACVERCVAAPRVEVIAAPASASAP